MWVLDSKIPDNFPTAVTTNAAHEAQWGLRNVSRWLKIEVLVFYSRRDFSSEILAKF